MSQIELIEDDRIPDEDLREREADLTPGPVVLQGLQHLARTYKLAPVRFLDPCAGAGVFGQQCRRVWPGAFRVGIEKDHREEPSLEHNYNEHMVGDALELLTGPAIRDLAPFDLIATNPAFSIFRELVPMCLPLLAPRGRLALYQSIDAGTRGPKGNALFEAHPPVACAHVSGGVTHRVGVNPRTGRKWGQDQRTYGWWIWDRGHAGPYWASCNLPRLPSEDRKWVVRPGEEWRYGMADTEVCGA